METNFQKYKAFLSAVETGSITSAANRLGYTQSAVSRMIADLEETLGLCLFERAKSGVKLTSDGKAFLTYVKKLMYDCDKLDEYVLSVKGINRGIIRIGTFSSVAAHESVYYNEFALKCIRLFMCMTAFAMVNKGTFIFLQSIGRAWESALLSLLREIVFGVGLVLVLPVYFGLYGILYFMPVADTLTFIISAAVIFGVCKSLSKAEKESDVKLKSTSLI